MMGEEVLVSVLAGVLGIAIGLAMWILNKTHGVIENLDIRVTRVEEGVGVWRSTINARLDHINRELGEIKGYVKAISNRTNNK